MKKLIIGLLLIISGVGLYLLINRISLSKKVLPDTTDSDEAVVESKLDYKLIGCKGGGMDLKGKVDVSTISDGKLHFNQKLVTYCNANKDNLKLRLEADRNELIIREIFESDIVVKCVCPLTVEGAVSGLEEGRDYKVRFVFENKYTDSEEILYEAMVERSKRK